MITLHPRLVCGLQALTLDKSERPYLTGFHLDSTGKVYATDGYAILMAEPILDVPLPDVTLRLRDRVSRKARCIQLDIDAGVCLETTYHGDTRRIPMTVIGGSYPDLKRIVPVVPHVGHPPVISGKYLHLVSEVLLHADVVIEPMEKSAIMITPMRWHDGVHGVNDDILTAMWCRSCMFLVNGVA